MGLLKDNVREMKKNTQVADYFPHNRWQLITLMEKLAGTWPYQTNLTQYSLQLYHFLVLLTILSALANQMRKSVGVNFNVTLDCFLFMIVILTLIIKLIFSAISLCSKGMIYERVVNHFEIIKHADEAKVLNECANQAFAYTIGYLGSIGIAVLIFNSTPVFRSFYNYYVHHDQLNMQLPIPMDYGFDHKKYWYILAADYLMFIYSGLIVEFAYDLSFILQIRHVQSLFTIVRMRLNRASEMMDESAGDGDIENAAEESYSMITSAIDLHSKCLEMVRLIEQTHNFNWFFILLMSTAAFGGAIHSVSTKLHDPPELFRYILTFCVAITHFQVIFSQGQVIIDSSTAIADACYDSKWYNLSKKSCKLLISIMMRTSIPCRLTGAKLFPLSMETFGKMLKAGISYYTIFQT